MRAEGPGQGKFTKRSTFKRYICKLRPLTARNKENSKENDAHVGKAAVMDGQGLNLVVLEQRKNCKFRTKEGCCSLARLILHYKRSERMTRAQRQR